MRRSHLLALALVLLAAGAASSAAPWIEPVYLGRGDPWLGRIPITFGNRGARPVEGVHVAIPIGSGIASDRIPLAGRTLDDIRVLDARGREMLYAVLDGSGRLRERGTLAPGDTFILPVECPPKAETRSFVYFDNRTAWAVPDFLEDAALPDPNGGFERGTGEMPASWQAKEIDPQHRITWARGEGRDGGRCVRVDVDPDARPSWVGAVRRQTGVVPGTRHRIEGWIRTRDVQGNAGWFVHAGNTRNSQLLNRTSAPVSGTTQWRAIAIEFTAPPEADSLTIGTVLRGTGTAWFDDVTISGPPIDTVSVAVEPPERSPLAERGRVASWPDDPVATKRVRLAISNPDAQPLRGVLARVDLQSARASARDWTPVDLRLGTSATPFFQLGNALFFECTIPARTCHIFHLAFAPPPAGSSPARAAEYPSPDSPVPASDIPSDHRFVPGTDPMLARAYAALLRSPSNLVRNADFSAGDTLPDGWDGPQRAGDPGHTFYSVDRPGLFGRQCARLTVPHDAGATWRG